MPCRVLPFERPVRTVRLRARPDRRAQSRVPVRQSDLERLRQALDQHDAAVQALEIAERGQQE
jgi:hypothetical protein